MDVLISIAALSLVLGVVVSVHEFGHLIVAKLFGVRVLTFSFGFGKRLIGFRLGETDYRISLVPLGGYVSLSGENPGDSSGDDRDFTSKPRWQRVLILFAGPAMNGILAIVIFSAIFMAVGQTQATHFVVEKIEPDSPASISDLRIGDKLQTAGGRPVGSLKQYLQVIQYIENNPDSPISLEILRGNEPIDIIMTPDNRDGKGKIGAGFNASDLRKERLGPISAFREGTSFTSFFVKLTLESVGEVILGKRSAKNSFAGPIGIASMSGSAASQGIVALLGLTALISISVGLANLVLPIPILDGGKIYILFAEMIRRKDFSARIQQRLAITGLILIAALFAVVIYIDLMRIMPF
jgi:regulator of sigma E protease